MTKAENIPKGRLDEKIPIGITVRELLERVAHFSLYGPVKDAVKDKLA
jgi:hypothetical protein